MVKDQRVTSARSTKKAKAEYLGWREFLLRQLVRALAVVFYRRRVHNPQALAHSGPALLIANHLTFVDWLFISSACPRPVRFVMDHQYLGLWPVGWIFRIARVIGIAPAKENPALLDEAYAQIAQSLRDGDMVCIFPEGALSKDGKMAPFRPGILRILEETPVPVIPIGLPSKLWHSRFARNKDRKGWLHRMLDAKISVHVGEAILPEAGQPLSLDKLQQEVQALVQAADGKALKGSAEQDTKD